MIDKFAVYTHTGLRLGKINAGRRRFTVSETVDMVESLDQVQRALEQTEIVSDARLFAHLRTDGLSVQGAWQKVGPDAPSTSVDTANLVSAKVQRSSRVVFAQSNDKLDKILGHPLAKWRVLHPAQRKIARAARYGGSPQVTSGALTGATVTSLHRTGDLARKADQRLVGQEPTQSPLVIIFPNNLEEVLQSQYTLLVDDEETRSRPSPSGCDQCDKQAQWGW